MQSLRIFDRRLVTALLWVPWNTPPINVDVKFSDQEMTTTSRLFSTPPISATMDGIRLPGAPFDL